MTVSTWQACLRQFQNDGTHNEKMMATLLLQLSQINDPYIVRIFDAYGSEILEMAS